MSISIQRMKQVETEGRHAAALGKSKDSCPYSDTQFVHYWEKGYDAEIRDVEGEEDSK